ncbi:hypothetical protein J31TS4_23620 [Paenibacillus sp. J31TS4]|uniref:cytochrome c oxidase subunit 2A n=1 Tax=Paenibacillus sp. J31TS4 TaxID=2807195 RepID=UPI001B0FF9F4|nr:cytochrome c oxidase subunit 2A [Paenibacillus sp. J31TS4]GIP39082.1 hypothetical protein J31TS4_23620 [Paenibacillus sp. J31TS4]
MAKSTNLVPHKKDVPAKAASRTSGETESSLKGTFAAVLLLGGFIILTWAGVFLLFLARQ